MLRAAGDKRTLSCRHRKTELKSLGARVLFTLQTLGQNWSQSYFSDNKTHVGCYNVNAIMSSDAIILVLLTRVLDVKLPICVM